VPGGGVEPPSPRYECGASPAMLTGHVRSRPGDLHTASPAYKAGALLSMLGGRCWCLPEELHLAPPLYQSGVPLPELGGRSPEVESNNRKSPSEGQCRQSIGREMFGRHSRSRTYAHRVRSTSPEFPRAMANWWRSVDSNHNQALMRRPHLPMCYSAGIGCGYRNCTYDMRLMRPLFCY
jgi:hypothetical protein